MKVKLTNDKHNKYERWSAEVDLELYNHDYKDNHFRASIHLSGCGYSKEEAILNLEHMIFCLKYDLKKQDWKLEE